MREIKIEYLVIYEDKPTTKTVKTLAEIEQGIMSFGSALSAHVNGVKEIHRRQWIGLTINKQDLFEDDIIKVTNVHGEETIHLVKNFEHESYPAYDLEPPWEEDSNSLSSLMVGNGGTIEIIGNKIEHGDLLK